MHTIATWWMWVGFFIFVFFVLAIDMLLLRRQKSHVMPPREALSWVLIWATCAFIFNALLWWYLTATTDMATANQKALEFFTGYIIEESLSIDNMFVFLMIFNYFAVPQEYQRRVLLYGVLGAIVLRFLMIIFGTWLIVNFHWILYIFGAFLVYSGIKMILVSHDKNELGDNILLRTLQKNLRLTKQFHGEYFFIRQGRYWYATPLFLVVIMIELSDLIFALDSIPAIFSVTNDPFIVFTSNIFAIMGLRALYFMLVHMANRFRLLKYGIALMLVFIGFKMLIAPWIKISITMALAVVVAILGTTLFLSVLTQKGKFRWKS